MDGSTRKRKQEELATWQRNLATLEAQAAGFGMAPPVEIVNEIETARRNIKRVQQEIDAGAEQSAEATIVSLLELVLVNNRRLDDAHTAIVALLQRMENIERRLLRTTTPSRAAMASRWASLLILAGIYTCLMIKEIRDVILANPLASILIIVLFALLAGLLRLLSTLLQPGAASDD